MLPNGISIAANFFQLGLLPTREPSPKIIHNRAAASWRNAIRTRSLALRARVPAGGVPRDFTGQSPPLGNSLSNFYFHCTTAYDIHCGVEVGKRDFMGTPVSL